MGNIKKNLSFQTLYQISTVIFPLLTAPYLARTLGAEKLGTFSFLYSIAIYFATFSELGVSNYGSRSIAEVRNDDEKRSTVFWEIFWMKCLTSGVSLLAYILYLLFFCKSDIVVASILVIPTLSVLVSINFLFFGTEQFQITAIRSLIVRSLCTVFIFLFVHDPSDLYKYVLIEVASTFLSNLYMWLRLPKVVQFKRVEFKNICKHIKPNLLLFVPIAAMSVYHLMDKTMLGILSTDLESGFYYNADKAVNVPIGIFSGITVVLLPRVTSLIREGKTERFKKEFSLALYAMIVLAVYMCAGMAAIAKEFVPVFFGDGYESCVALIIYLSVVIIIKAVSFTIRSLYLIPMHKEKWYITSTFVGAGVNLVSNCLLIPTFGALGAVIGTLLAEGSACITQIAAIKKDTQLGLNIFKVLPSIIISLLMVVAVRYIAGIIGTSIIGLIAEIVVGVCIAGALSFVYWKATSNELLEFVITLKSKKE